MTQLVVFGFEPFEEEPVNPSGQAALFLHGRLVAGARVHGVVLPVSYQLAFPTLHKVLEDVAPDGVLGVGQGKDRFHVENWAFNVVGVRKDNDGRTLGRTRVDGSGEERLGVSLDVEAVFAAVQGAVGQQAPVAMSDSAGDYLCNHTLYRLLQWNEDEIPAGFLHIPRLAHCSQAVTNQAVEAALGALLPPQELP